MELASFGWEVTGIDHLPDAIARAETLASRYSLNSKFIRGDVVTDNLPDEGFDLVCMFFFLHRETLERCVRSLEAGGLLMLETFSEVNRAHFGKPSLKRFVLGESEILRLTPGLAVIHHSEEWRESGKHTVRYVGRKSANGA